MNEMKKPMAGGSYKDPYEDHSSDCASAPELKYQMDQDDKKDIYSLRICITYEDNYIYTLLRGLSHREPDFVSFRPGNESKIHTEVVIGNNIPFLIGSEIKDEDLFNSISSWLQKNGIDYKQEVNIPEDNIVYTVLIEGKPVQAGRSSHSEALLEAYSLAKGYLQ